MSVVLVSICMLTIPSSCGRETIESTKASQSNQSMVFAGESLKAMSIVSKIVTNNSVTLEQKFNLFVAEVPKSDMNLIVSAVKSKLNIPIESSNIGSIEYITAYTNNIDPSNITLSNIVGVSLFTNRHVATVIMN